MRIQLLKEIIFSGEKIINPLNSKISFKLIIYSLSLMTFIDAVGGSLIFPIISALFMDNKNGLILNDTVISRQMLYGLSFALFPLASIISMPLLGSLSDKHGRKKVIFIGCALLTFDYLISMLSILLHNVWLFLLGRLFTGLLSGVSAGINALIADFSANSNELISNLKLPMLASIAGFILGPSLSIFVTGSHALSLSTPFMVGFVLSNINLLILAVLFLTFKHSKMQDKGLTCQKQSAGIFTILMNDILFIFNDKKKMVLGCAYITFQLGICLFIQSLSLYLAVSFQYKPYQISFFFIGMALFLTLGMYVLQPILNRIINQNLQLQLGVRIILGLFFIGFVVVKWSFIFGNNYIFVFWSLSAIVYLFLPLINLNFIRLFTNLGDDRTQGRTMGGIGQLSAIGMLLSSLIVGEITFRAEWMVFLISGITLVFTYRLLLVFLSNSVKEICE